MSLLLPITCIRCVRVTTVAHSTFMKRTFTSAAFVTGGRIVFAVTKFDSSYTGYGEEPTLFQTQQHVKEGLIRLGFDVPLDDIVPLSGQWALLARQLQPDSQPRELRCAQGYLIAFKGKQPHGEGEDSIDVQVHSMELRNMAKELEKASNILILEERLVTWLSCSPL